MFSFNSTHSKDEATETREIRWLAYTHLLQCRAGARAFCCSMLKPFSRENVIEAGKELLQADPDSRLHS